MLFRRFNDPTETLFKELNTPDFHSQHNLIIGKFMWQVNNNEIPQNISQLFHVKNRIIELELRESLLKDMIIIGSSDKKLQERLLRENVSLDRTVEIRRTVEITLSQANITQNGAPS